MHIESINRFKTNLRIYSFIWISILVSAIFICLPFFDNNNLAAWVNALTTLTNSSPALQNSSWPGGPFFLSIFVPLGYFYILTGYSLYHTAILLKIILFVFTILTGYLSYKIAERINPKYSKFTFLFIMTNPATIYVNYIWAQLDIIPIFFTLLSFYALYFTDFDQKRFMIQLLLLVPLFIAIFTYYYPVILIPSFVIYSKNKNTSIRRFLSFAILGVIFILTDFFLFGAFILSTVTSLAPTARTKYFQGLQSVVIIPEPVFILVLLLISIIVPLVTKKLRLSVYVPIYIILLSLMYVSNVSLPDNFLWILPFSILVILCLDGFNRKKTLVALSNIFLFTGILFINFYIGTGTQAGIFYYGYRIFHYNFLFIRNLGAFHLYVQVYFIFLTFSFVFSVLVILFINMRYNKGEAENAKDNIIPLNSIGDDNKYIKRTHRVLKSNRVYYLRGAVVILILFLILVAGSFEFNSNAFSKIDYKGSNTVPIYYFAPSYKDGIFAMPINNITYQLDGQSINFSSHSPYVSLSRVLHNEFINLSMNERIRGNCVENISLVQSSLFSVNLYRSLLINNSVGSGIQPVNTINASSRNITIENVTSPVEVYNMSLGNLFIYKFKNIEEQRTIFYNISNILSPSSTFNQTVPFGLRIGNFTFNMVLYKNSGLLVFHNNTNSCFVAPFTYHTITSNWNLFTYMVDNGSLDIKFDSFNYRFRLPVINDTNNEFVYVGAQPGFGKTHSFMGEVSIMYNSSKFRCYRDLKILVKDNEFEKTFNASGNSVNIGICDNKYNTKLLVNNNSMNFNKTLSYLTFGKLDSYNYGLIITVNTLLLNNIESGSYYMIPVYFAFLIPYIATFFMTIYIKKR